METNYEDVHLTKKKNNKNKIVHLTTLEVHTFLNYTTDSFTSQIFFSICTSVMITCKGTAGCNLEIW